MQIQKELFDIFPEKLVVKRSPDDRLTPECWLLRKVLLAQTKLSGMTLCPLSTVCFFQFNQSWKSISEDFSLLLKFLPQNYIEHLYTVLLSAEIKCCKTCFYRISPLQMRIHIINCLMKKARRATWHTLYCVCCVILASYLDCHMTFFFFFFFFAILPNSFQILPNPCSPTRVRAWPFCGDFRCTVYWYVIWNRL